MAAAFFAILGALLWFMIGASTGKGNMAVATAKEHKQQLKNIIHRPKSAYGEIVRAVGTSNYDRQIQLICGPKTSEQVNISCEVVLVPEKGNPHDPRAVRVEMSGKTVGYLSRPDARKHRSALYQLGIQGMMTAFPARITGGYKYVKHGETTEGYYGIEIIAATPLRADL